MAFARPTLQDLITRVEGDIRGGLSLVTLLRRSFLKVFARALAGLAHVLFGYLAYIEREAFPDTAIDNITRWAGIWGVFQKEATYAKFQCSVSGSPGTVIPINRVYRRTDGFEYTAEAEVTLTGSGDTIVLIASTSGKAGAVSVSDQIAILTPIAGLTSEATVTTIITEPEDLETPEALQDRLIDRIQNPPSGGNANDYKQWALAVPGITRAWVGPQALGPGTVVVYPVLDANDPITPSPAKITEVFDYIETLRPVTANVTVTAPVLLPLDLTIAIKPNNADTQDAIETELKDLIFRDAALAGSYKSPGVLHTGKILLSRLNEAISIATGEDDHEIIDVNGGAPADVTPATGELIVLGVITWQTQP